MRSKNAFKNLVISLSYELIVFVLGLIVPRLIILSYGDAVNGLTQTVTRLLTLINLIQAGAVGATIYQMYKPVADNDIEAQSAIIYSSNRYFKKLGIIYLVAAFVVGAIFSWYLKNKDLDFVEIFLSFVVLAVNGSLYFFFTSKYDVVFSSYQKRYLLTISSLVERFVYYALLFTVALGGLHFLCMYGALLIGGVIRVLINTAFYNKLVGDKIQKKPRDISCKIGGRKALMMNSIGTEMITAAPTVIITTFVGLESSSVFSIYAMIYTSIKTIINSIHLSVSAIFGNLVAKADNGKIANVFNVLVYIFVVIGAFLASCTAFLIIPFIDIYTAGLEGQNYKFPVLAVFVIAYIILFSFRIVYSFVSTVYGLFKEMCTTTLTLGSIAIVISTVCTILFGMSYVMVGVLFFHLSYSLVLLNIFKKRISWFNFNKMLRRVVLILVLPTVSYLLYVFCGISVNSFVQWLLLAVVFAIGAAMCLVVYSVLFEKKEFNMLLSYIKKMKKQI